MRSRGLRRLLAIAGAVRSVWDTVGLTLLLIGAGLVLWTAGRATVQALAGRGGSVPSPIDTAAWGSGFSSEFERSLRMRWEPYVYWRRRPLAGEYVNVDSAGLRRTVVPWASDTTIRTIYFLGGSTMWGTGQRDAHTIPSLVSRGLAAAGWRGVDVRNFGESGYVFTQEVIALALALRDGARPDLVVFYDGINDLAAGLMNGRGGLPQNESRRALEFSIGRFLSRRGRQEAGDVVANLMARLNRPLGVDPEDLLTNNKAVDSLATRVVSDYAHTAELVEALAKAYGFQVLYFWQPAPGTTGKPLTAFEKGLLESSPALGLPGLLPPLSRAAASQIDSVMGPRAPGRFIRLTDIFDGDTSSVWLDAIGHVTEEANERIAGAMVPAILALLGPVPAR